jgi:hypothetical protein
VHPAENGDVEHLTALGSKDADTDDGYDVHAGPQTIAMLGIATLGKSWVSNSSPSGGDWELDEIAAGGDPPV